MSDATRLMAKIRRIPNLDKRIDIFFKFLKQEYQYDSFSYGVAFDFSSPQALWSRFLFKARGMNPEWLEQYGSEGLGTKDPAVFHMLLREDVLLHSQVLQALEAGDIPPPFDEVPIRARAFIKSGFFLPLRGRGFVGGMGLFASHMNIVEHDTHFKKHGQILVELCHQFHGISSWHKEIIKAIGLTEANLQILQLRAQGLQYKEIIKITGHAHHNSVIQHMERVRDKLSAKNEQQALSIATGLGLIGHPKFINKIDKYLISLRPNGQKCYNTSAVRWVLAG